MRLAGAGHAPVEEAGDDMNSRARASRASSSLAFGDRHIDRKRFKTRTTSL
jgi:hypothetical protein